MSGNKRGRRRDPRPPSVNAKCECARKQRRIDTLGKDNAARVEPTLSAVRQATASEAARAGWLGDVDFSADIKVVTARKACAFSKLSVIRAAIERSELVGKCAKEAQPIDKSLRTEREDARIADQRAELYA